MADINQFLVRGSARLRATAFGCLCGWIVLSPWCFGAWEMWWFWPMATLGFLGAFCAGVGVLLQTAFLQAGTASALEGEPRLRSEGRLALVLLAVSPFLLYAVWRGTQPSAPGYPLVEMEAERSLLLFATPVLLLVALFLVATRRRVRTLVSLFLANAVVLALYASANHWITRDTYVLWVKTPFNYGARAGGVFFCPNHLAAYMNLALCLILAWVLSRRTAWKTRFLLLVLAVPILTAWFLTLSRGGTASLVSTLPLVLLAGLRGYPWKARLATAMLLVVLVAGSVTAVLRIDNPLLARIQQHALIQSVLKVRQTGWAPVRKTFFLHFDRGTYIDSALRAWRTHPRLGIGPGQHAIRWPQFAATGDGDRAKGKWPTLTNHDYYLYEVHSDWTQLLEEYGTLGLSLFLFSCLVAVGLLWHAQGRGLRCGVSPLEQALPLAALLSLGAFAVHSLGDFSLQIPAITWTLAALVACGLLTALPEHGDSEG